MKRQILYVSPEWYSRLRRSLQGGGYPDGSPARVAFVSKMTGIDPSELAIYQWTLEVVFSWRGVRCQRELP